MAPKSSSQTSHEKKRMEKAVEAGPERKRPTASERKAREVGRVLEKGITITESQPASQIRTRGKKHVATRSKKAATRRDDSSDDDVPLARMRDDAIHEAGSGPSQVAEEEEEEDEGPIGCSILKSIENHISLEIWKDPKSSRILRVINHAKLCSTCAFDDLKESVKEKITPTGLQYLAKYSYPILDHAMISAFVERWHPETNSFHLADGELTITLDDVHHILGLRVDGREMSMDISEGDFDTYDEIVELVGNSLGVEPKTFVTLPEFKKSFGVPLSFLRNTFIVDDDDDDNNANDDFVARGYMQFILGAVGITDKSGTAIHAKYLNNFTDLNNVNQISFGSGILAHLYRELGAASRVESKTIAGCQTLLHAWIYEHFPTLNRATLNRDYDEQMSRMCRWKPAKIDTRHPHTLATLRVALEDLTANEIIWHPYRDLRDTTRPVQPVALFRGPISCHEIEEPHIPDRVLRQFGYVQNIPSTLRLRTAAKGKKPSTYVPPYYPWGSYFFTEWQQHLVGETIRTPAVEMWDCTEDYMDYYVGAGHGMILNPDKRTAKVAVAAPLPSKSVLYDALQKMTSKVKKLEKCLIMSKGKNYEDVGTQMQNIADDYPFIEEERRTKMRHEKD